MKDLLLDASVWLAALDQDDRYHVASARLLESFSGAIEVPALAALDLTLYEVANVAVVHWRSRIHAQRVVQLVRLACPVIDRVDDELLDDAVEIAEEHGLTIYDAAYVASARKRGRALVSCDLKDLVRPGFAVTPDAVP